MVEKKAWDTQNIDQSAMTGLLDAVWSGMHKANEPSRGHALTSGVLHGTARGLGHGLSSAATLLLLDKLLPGSASGPVGTGLKMVAGPVAGMIGGRLLPELAGAAVDKLRPSHPEGSERTASLKGGAMNVQELARRALANIKQANGPECGEMSGSGSYGEETDTTNSENRNFLTKRRGWNGGPSIAEAVLPFGLGEGMTRFNDDAGRGSGDVLLRGADSAAGGLAHLVGGGLTNAALQGLTGIKVDPENLKVLPMLAHYFAHQLGGTAASQLMPKVGAAQLAKLALAGSDPLNSQSANQDPGILRQVHDALAKKRGLLGGASALQLGGELAGHLPGAGTKTMMLGPLMAAYSRMMEPGQGWAEGIGQGAVSGLASAAGKVLPGAMTGRNITQPNVNGELPAHILGNLASILGSNIKIGEKTKKANLTQPMGVPVKSEFTHNPMGEPMDMSATSQAGSMGTAAPKKDKKDGKDKKADDDESTAMRSFMGTWSRSKDIYAKSAAYKNFMSRVGKYQALDY